MRRKSDEKNKQKNAPPPPTPPHHQSVRHQTRETPHSLTPDQVSCTGGDAAAISADLSGTTLFSHSHTLVYLPVATAQTHPWKRPSGRSQELSATRQPPSPTRLVNLGSRRGGRVGDEGRERERSKGGWVVVVVMEADSTEPVFWVGGAGVGGGG